jgi:hypothetical protein
MNIAKLRNSPSHGTRLRRTALALAIAASAGMTGQVLAQATTATIFGTAPVAAGETVQVVGGSGFNRTAPVDSAGRYSITVPVGTYTVNLLQDGKVVQSQANVTPNVAGAQAVNFASAGANEKSAQTLSTVTVTGNALPAIDVTSTREATVITAEQLKHLPVARSAESIALLAPGTVAGASMLGTGAMGNSMVSFGGSSVAENAYYINGFNTSDPLANAGGITLPYGSIAQQETLTSGYGAKYGRSAGGVISQVGKSGTNDWQFGGQVLWTPAFARSNYINYHYNNPRTTQAGQQQGDLYTYRNANRSWETVYDAYIGGPLIKDKLFFFLSAESDRTHSNVAQSIRSGKIYDERYSDPKMYAKLDWNINENNSLALTYVSNKDEYGAQIHGLDYATKKQTGYINDDVPYKNAFKLWLGQYTAYITDNLTLNAMYGQMKGTYYSVPAGGVSPLPNIIAGPQCVGNECSNSNPVINVADPTHRSTTTNLRLDLDWKLGNHDLKVGIDNDTTVDKNDGQAMSGPLGYAWEYQQAPNPGQPINGAPGEPGYIGAPTDPNGYYVDKYVFVTAASAKVTQRAQYIEDDWQALPNLLLTLGLRNDQFTNYNPGGVPFLRLTSPQWAPRLGFSWDVFGDSSLKVYGNAGRYYLAMPPAVTLRDAGAPLFTRTYYNYTSIGANGIPQNITPIDTSFGPGGAVPINGSNGQPLDPKVVASTNLKAEYQDEFVLGMQQEIKPGWVYGVSGTLRRLGRVIDDVGASGNVNSGAAPYDTGHVGHTVCDMLTAQGYNPSDCNNIDGSILINPGSTNTIRVSNGAGGYDLVKVTPQDFGFPKVKRKYYALEAYLEHPWDGKWYGKIDYVFSKSYGDTEGPVQSNIGQGGNSVSATEQWDYGSLMQYSNGLQANDRRHVLKAYGTYQIAPEWTLSGILTVASGTPKSCLGYWGPQEIDAINYGASYHWCGGAPAVPGHNGRTPWTHPLNLSVEYRPLWADKKLGFQLQVHNVFNEQKTTQIRAGYGSTAAPDPRYNMTYASEAPRYVQMGVTYDW